MENLNKNQTNATTRRSQVKSAASDLLVEGKKLANELYEDGLNRVNDAEEVLREYSNQALRKIQEYPLTSVLIAGGIGFILSKLIKK